MQLPAQDANINWILDKTEEIINETDLCERCDRLNPNISIVTFNGSKFLFLRYGCTPLLRVIERYQMTGAYVDKCQETDQASDCGQASVATVFTFADNVEIIWSCESGFSCDFAELHNLGNEIPINVDNERCAQGIKRLWVSPDYTEYVWEPNVSASTTNEMEITEPGRYRITVTNEEGCESKGEIVVDDLETIDFRIKGKPVLCEEGQAELFATGYDSYRWSEGSDGNSIKVDQTGTYEVTVTNSSGCEGMASFTLAENEPLGVEIVATPEEIFEGSSTQLSIAENVDPNDVRLWSWSGDGLFDCTECPMPNYQPNSTGDIELLIQDDNGCIERASYNLELKELPLFVYTPNVIDQVGSAPNNSFTIYGGANIEFVETLEIFDRWGNEVFSRTNFEASQPNNGWNGQLTRNTSEGTEASNQYVYNARVRFKNGKKKVFKGSFTVVR